MRHFESDFSSLILIDARSLNLLNVYSRVDALKRFLFVSQCDSICKGNKYRRKT